LKNANFSQKYWQKYFQNRNIGPSSILKRKNNLGSML
jgi:hypothetical protein